MLGSEEGGLHELQSQLFNKVEQHVAVFNVIHIQRHLNPYKLNLMIR